MTNTNPLTDRLQREMSLEDVLNEFDKFKSCGCQNVKDACSECPSLENYKDWLRTTLTLYASQIRKETLTAFQGDPLGLYTVAHYKQESNDYMRGASDQFLADQKKIKDILTTLTSSPEIGKE